MADVGAKGASARFDVVIVGARCAGAALAQRLAAAGRSVALLDAAKLPSDQHTSTHLIQPPGMAELDLLGVGDAVRATSPALRAVRLSYDGNEARLPYRDGGEAHCLRRETLDGFLQQAAVKAGAELRPESKVIDLLRDESGRVEGVVARVGGEATEQLRAGLVVGADGRSSTIAKLVGAQEYLAYDGPRSVYWAYWQRPPDWNAHELQNTFEGTEARIVFPTDSNQLLIAAVPTLDRAKAWRSDHTASYLANIRAYDLVASHLGDDKPLGEVRGVLKPRYFFRASAGPGWVLIGDAGHHKEFVIGLGISEALRDAHGLAQAVLEGGPEATQVWWRRRDVERVEMFYWSREMGRAEPVNALQRLATGRLGRSPKLQGNFAEMMAGERRPYDFVPDASAAPWIVGSLLHGDLSPIPPLIGLARRRAHARRELRARRRLARRAERKLDHRLP